MTRRRLLALGIAALLVAVIVWIGNHTEWAEIPLSIPPEGEARRNPFYAAQRFAEALGASTSREHLVGGARPDAVILVSSWHWTLSAGRRQALEAWVESGGRLVLDQTVIGGSEDLERWSGIGRRQADREQLETLFNDGRPERCRMLRQPGIPADVASRTGYSLCYPGDQSSLRFTGRNPAWSLEDETGLQVVRTRVGRGSVTMINATPFGNRPLFEGDHARLFVAVTQLKRGDEVHFLSEEEHPSLIALAWSYGAPVAVLALATIALTLWRGAVRLGPLAQPPDSARRSLAEQIRGTGQFALRYGHGSALHTAIARALAEAAGRRISGYARLAPDERVAAIATLTGLDSGEITAAMNAGAPRRSRGLRHAIAVLETARRRAVVERRRGGRESGGT
ncbi:MAG TPA: DUF4350 domain-containing protein [Vicinamibacterales bacterium]|nr:DUF4350 domain-containing protein [Vicinamibacterales bacterium]